MKFTLTFKTPNVCDHIEQAVCGELSRRNITDEDEANEVGDNLTHECKTLANKFVEYGEYVTIEFDTNNGTATVIRV